MATAGGPNIETDGLVLALDASNIKSFRGEPTTNLTINDSNFTTTNYAFSSEWVSLPTVFTKSFNPSITTPIGIGATLLSESGNNGYHHLSSWGGGGFGNHSLSCYIFPLSNNIINFTIGLLVDNGNVITFNLNTKTITYGSGAVSGSAFIEEVKGFPGWLRVGGNHGGRNGGWVGCIGLSTNTAYTGTLNGKAFYITGIQYETTPTPTTFTPAQTTRGTTVATGGGWVDKSGNNNHGELVNGPTFDSENGGSLVFDGVNDYLSIDTTNLNNLTEGSVEFWFQSPNTGHIFSFFTDVNNFFTICTGDSTGFWVDESIRIIYRKSGTYYYNYAAREGNSYYADNKWHHCVFTVDSSGNNLYTNGLLLTVEQWHSSTEGNTSSRWFNDLSPDNITFGRRIDNYTNVEISSAKIYNRALTAEEILQNYNATKSRFNL